MFRRLPISRSKYVLKKTCNNKNSCQENQTTPFPDVAKKIELQKIGNEGNFLNTVLYKCLTCKPNSQSWQPTQEQ